MKRLYLAGAVVVAALFMSGCGENTYEQITASGKSIYVFDDLNVVLKDGYWVKDFTVDYDNMTVTFRLEED